MKQSWNVNSYWYYSSFANVDNSIIISEANRLFQLRCIYNNYMITIASSHTHISNSVGTGGGGEELREQRIINFQTVNTRWHQSPYL
jgi:hypothetical protein